MESLPQEIMDIIVSQGSRKELKTLRLTSKSLSVAATEALFSYVHTNPEAYSQKAFQAILEDTRFSRLVRTLRYTTFQGSDKELSEYGNDQEESELSEELATTLGAFVQFPNLQAVQLVFAKVCSNPKPGRHLPAAEQSIEFRYQFMEKLFAALDTSLRSHPQPKSLSIKNLQNKNVKSFVGSDTFLSIISSLKELRLGVIVQYDSTCFEDSWAFSEMHDFWKELPGTWLRPACDNLESLALHMDSYWGYFPKCDLRKIHFRKLRTLELGNYSFSHDWQHKWILRHGETLEELVLDHCCILTYTANFGAMDEEKYPVQPEEDRGRSYFYEYPRAWSTYFSRFKRWLPHLKTFRMGSGDWRDGINFFGEGHWRTGLNEERYMTLDRTVESSPWQTVDAFPLEDFMGSDLDEPILEPRDGTEVSVDLDYSAYDELMAAVKARG
ncbi:hypothetical protein MMC25_003383 [Agyrium rufum]|nr:hypothetical protein [Agyrium rufum]